MIRRALVRAPAARAGHALPGDHRLHGMLAVIGVRHQQHDDGDLAALGGRRASEDGEIRVAREIARAAGRPFRIGVLTALPRDPRSMVRWPRPTPSASARPRQGSRLGRSGGSESAETDVLAVPHERDGFLGRENRKW